MFGATTAHVRYSIRAAPATALAIRH